MGVPPEKSRSIRADAARRTTIQGVPSYALYTDEQLLAERDRLRYECDELTMRPLRSSGVGQLLAGIEQEIEGISDELMRRARSRHPSSRSLSTRMGFGSVPRLPDTD